MPDLKNGRPQVHTAVEQHAFGLGPGIGHEQEGQIADAHTDDHGALVDGAAGVHEQHAEFRTAERVDRTDLRHGKLGAVVSDLFKEGGEGDIVRLRDIAQHRAGMAQAERTGKTADVVGVGVGGNDVVQLRDTVLVQNGPDGVGPGGIAAVDEHEVPVALQKRGVALANVDEGDTQGAARGLGPGELQQGKRSAQKQHRCNKAEYAVVSRGVVCHGQ